MFLLFDIDNYYFVMKKKKESVYTDLVNGIKDNNFDGVKSDESGRKRFAFFGVIFYILMK